MKERFNIMIQNIVIGKPFVEPWQLISKSKEDFENVDKQFTLFTNERFLPKILVDAGIVKSSSEVKRNKPELWVTLNTVDCKWIKWGKQKIFIVIGE